MTDEMDYELLLKKIKKQQLEIDELRQTLHDCKNQNKVLNALEKEYQEEIKTLQAANSANVLQYVEVGEKNSRIAKEFHERLETYEEQLRLKNQEIEKLNSELELSYNVTKTHQGEDETELLEEIDNLRQEHGVLASNLDKLQKLCDREQLQNGRLLETVDELNNELEHYKELTDCKKRELEEANTLIENLKDDYLCLKSELDLINSKPLDTQSRGNSLFAEVDDRRVQLQQNVNIMKSQYLEMKRERVSHLKQIASLQSEKAALLVQFQAEIEDREHDENTIIDSLKAQVTTLEGLIQGYRKELKHQPKSDVPPAQAMKFFNNMLTMKNEEIESLKQELSSKSSNNTTLTYDLKELRTFNRRKELEIVKLRNEIGQLKLKIEEMSIPITPPELKPPEAISLKSIVKPTKEENDESDKIEFNNKKHKIVQFSESTVDANVTERSKGRKGVRVQSVEPIKYV